MTRTVHRACPLCEATCGLSITVDGEAITAIVGDKEDPFSQGYLCPKALALQDLHEDPDRLRQPMRRVGAGWEPMSWEAALDLAAEELLAVQDAHGDDSVAMYLGNPTVHNLGAMIFAPEVMRALKTRQRYSATSADQLPHMLTAHWMFGHQFLMPVPDVDRADLMIILGANPAASNGSIMTAPAIGKRLKAIRARGGRVVVIDPRRTETAKLAGEHHFIRPGADALLLAAMLQTVFDEGLAEPGRLGAITDGLDVARAAVADLSPERVAGLTGIDAEVIRGLARDLAGTERAVLYGRLGVSAQRFGVLCQWLINVLNLVTGHLDAPGGAMFTNPAVDPLARPNLMGRGGFDRWRSRVRDLPEVNGELPVATLAEEMTTPGEGQVRALVTFAGNPALSTPDGKALDAAMAGLDFMVCIDPYLNETTRHAHLILPPVSPLERDHYDLAFNLLAVRNVAKWSPRVFAPKPDALDDWQILAGLQKRLVRGRGVTARGRSAATRVMGPAKLIDMALRIGPHPGLTLSGLKAAEHGMDLGPLTPALPARLFTAKKRIAAAPPPVIADVARLAASLEEDPGDSLLLIGRRQLRSNNSWMHNAPRLMKGKDRCTLLVHPDDAAARGLASGDTARVSSRVGSVEAPVVVSDEVMPGVVSLPHGFGHGRQGARLSVAGRQPGVSLNDLTDPTQIDDLGGTAVLSGVPVTVERAGT